MIEKAEEEEHESKVKQLSECMASEKSWRLSSNFQRDCKEANHLMSEDLMASM